MQYSLRRHMEFWRVPAADDLHERRAGKHGHDLVCTDNLSVHIACVCPSQQLTGAEQPRHARGAFDEDTIRQISQRITLSRTATHRCGQLREHPRVHRCRRFFLAESAGPRCLESLVVSPTAFTTRAMPSRQRRCFVKEEQLGVAVGRHERSLAIVEAQLAANPSLYATSLANNIAFAVVQTPSVTHEHPIGVRPLQFRIGRDSIL